MVAITKNWNFFKWPSKNHVSKVWLRLAQ
jgi:hypothetical protein